ncbi:MAG: Fe-S cluster assembly protein SufD, partial [Rhodoglobus sp.]|nr:Fe-S cluster assembly protein SufD [Rhodoglobus sp.]
MSVISPEQHGAKAHSDGGWDSNEPGYVPVQTRD